MDAEQVLDHERGWVAIELAEALAEISREHPDILMAVVYQYLQWRARNVIDIACGDIQHVPLQVLCDIDKNKEEVLAEIRHMQKGYQGTAGGMKAMANRPTGAHHGVRAGKLISGTQRQ